jgi:DNA modification methylase
MTYRILEGDCASVLATLEPQSVQTCVTSPPYWGLRDYGTATWEGGDAECDHRQETSIHADSTSTLGVPADGGPRRIGAENATVVGKGVYRAECGKCGAKRIDSQLGLEPTPEEYVANLVAVFREVKRVLRDDGTLWLNLGDSYVANYGNGGKGNTGASGSVDKRGLRDYKSKDLVGIPWMVAFALRADGWYLRSDIIWAKPNPMPESVTDRPTKAHEYLFLLTKSPRYFYDADAIRDEATHAGQTISLGPKSMSVGQATGRGVEASGNGTASEYVVAEGRNKRSVWTVTTQPFPGAHFATFPPKLIEPCILAGSPEGELVLDPFAGAGTTGVVALRHSRSFVGIELNPAYAQMARNRIYDDAPLLNLEAP